MEQGLQQDDPAGETLTEGSKVFVSEPNGKHYFGVLVGLDLGRKSLLIRFGDGSEVWSSFARVKPASRNHEPPISADALNPPPLTRANESVLISRRKRLNYNLLTLSWNDSHTINKQGFYCYCGQNSDWYKKMYQCHLCLQWFHQGCMKNKTLFSEMLYGDRVLLAFLGRICLTKEIHHRHFTSDTIYFQFGCSMCMEKEEDYLYRLDLSWEKALHLVLYHLTIEKTQTFHSLRESVWPFFKSKVGILQGPTFLAKSKRVDLGHLESILQRNKDRFNFSSQNGKKFEMCSLNKVCPPEPPDCIANRIAAANPPATKLTFRRESTHAAGLSYSKKYARKGSLLENGGDATGRKRKLSKQPLSSRRSQCHRDSSVDTLSSDEVAFDFRGTLDELIPPRKDFKGDNNPFSPNFKPQTASCATVGQLLISETSAHTSRACSPSSSGVSSLEDYPAHRHTKKKTEDVTAAQPHRQSSSSQNQENGAGINISIVARRKSVRGGPVEFLTRTTLVSPQPVKTSSIKTEQVNNGEVTPKECEDPPLKKALVCLDKLPDGLAT